MPGHESNFLTFISADGEAWWAAGSLPTVNEIPVSTEKEPPIKTIPQREMVMEVKMKRRDNRRFFKELHAIYHHIRRKKRLAIRHKEAYRRAKLKNEPYHLQIICHFCGKREKITLYNGDRQHPDGWIFATRDGMSFWTNCPECAEKTLR